MSDFKNISAKLENKQEYFALCVKENLDLGLDERLTKLHIQLLKYPFTNTTNNIWDYLNQIEVETIAPNPDESEESGNFITVNQIERILNKAINQILVNSHRGMGNIILCGGEFKEAINNTNFNDIKIIESTEIPSKEAIVSYIGLNKTDYPFFYYENEDGSILYKNHPDFKKYVVRLQLL